MSEQYGDDLEAEEAYIASCFVDFQTEKPGSGEWIPMTEDESRERWDSWLSEHDRQVAERAWESGRKAGDRHGGAYAINPYRKEG